MAPRPLSVAFRMTVVGYAASLTSGKQHFVYLLRAESAYDTGT